MNFQAFQANAFQNSPAFQTPGEIWEPHGGRIRIMPQGDGRRLQVARKNAYRLAAKQKTNIRVDGEPD